MFSTPFIVELLVIIGVCVTSLVIVWNTFASNLVRILIFGGVLLASLFLGVQIFRFSKSWSGNLVFSALVGLIIALICLVWVSQGVQRRSKRRDWPERLHEYMGLAYFWDRALTGVIVITMWLACFVAADLLGKILSVSSEGQTIVSQTVVLQYLVSLEKRDQQYTELLESSAGQEGKNSGQPISNEQQSKIRAAAATQADFFNRFSSGVQSTKERVYSATGLDSLHHEVELVTKIVNLSSEDKIWLIQQNEQMQDLVEHPIILRIVENDELMLRFDRFSKGAVEEILQIGMDPDINLLLEDEMIRTKIKQIDLEELLRQCEGRSGFKTEVSK